LRSSSPPTPAGGARWWVNSTQRVIAPRDPAALNPLRIHTQLTASTG